MYETDEALVVVAPMPGVTPDDVEIVVEADTLTIRAQLRASAPTKNYVMHEWDYGAYERSVPLPAVFHGDVTASLGNGQLAVSIQRRTASTATSSEGSSSSSRSSSVAMSSSTDAGASVTATVKRSSD
jgi:HSP20 family molecular chaperone IbpA